MYANKRRARVAALFKFLVTAFAGTAVCAFALTANAETGAKDITVKAAYIYNFAKFTRWPESSFTDETSRLLFCVHGSPEMLSTLKTMVYSRYIDKHPIEAADASVPGFNIASCHLVYYVDNPLLSGWELLRKLEGVSALTIGDNTQFLELGGAIGFINIDQRIKFDVNLAATQQSGMSLSSRLLGIARHVHNP